MDARTTWYRLSTWCLNLIRTLDATLIVLLVVLGLWATNAGAEFGNAQRRDCGEIARSFLARMGMAVDPPRVFTTVPIKVAGWYDSGVLFVRPDKVEDCGVWVHEYAHHAQYVMRGPATSYEEWIKREQEAARIELRWRGME
jgi:hypothetical protein